MKRLIRTLMASLVLLSLATPCLAQTEPALLRTQFYDFGELLIDGGRLTPTVVLSDARESVRLARLDDLRKSFLPRLLETGQEDVFKP